MNNPSPGTPRRDFLKQAALLGSLAALPSWPLGALAKEPVDNKGKGCTFLFQGDSITDGNRSRNTDWNHVMGHGYAYLVSSRLWFNYPAKEFHFFNRGISGNKVDDLEARWQEDALAIQPNVLSILVGINDVNTAVNGNTAYTAEKYEAGYRSLLDRTKQALPSIELVLCEPFALPVGKVQEKWEAYQKELVPRQAIVRRLAEEYKAVFVPLQQPFNDALAKAPAIYWIWDGIHPMPGGHELMAREWIKQVGKKLRFVRG